MALLDLSLSPSISGVAEISMVDSHSRIPLLIPPESCSLSTVWSWCWEGLSSMDYVSQPRFRQGTQLLSSGQCHEGRHDKYHFQGWSKKTSSLALHGPLPHLLRDVSNPAHFRSRMLNGQCLCQPGCLSEPFPHQILWEYKINLYHVKPLRFENLYITIARIILTKTNHICVCPWVYWNLLPTVWKNALSL